MILDDFSTCGGPTTVILPDLTADSLRAAVVKLTKPYREEKIPDPTGYYFSSYYNAGRIVQELEEQGCYCVNRYEKYYVIAFAVDYRRFEIFSKDRNKKLISWGRDDCDDPVSRLITDPDYNENPVVKLFQQLGLK